MAASRVGQRMNLELQPDLDHVQGGNAEARYQAGHCSSDDDLSMRALCIY